MSSSNETPVLVARAISLPAESVNEKQKDILDAITNQLNEISLEKKTKGIEFGIGTDDEPSKSNAQNKERGRGSGAISPADFVTMQSLRSSALARKMNTTSKLTRDCRNLFADLMQDNMTSTEIKEPIVEETQKGNSDKSYNSEGKQLNVKTIDEFINEAKISNRKLNHPKNGSKASKQQSKHEKEREEDERQLISRGPIRMCSLSSGAYQQYPLGDYGIAPQSAACDPSSYNPNVYNYTYECGMASNENYWTNSCESISNSSTPDTVQSELIFGNGMHQEMGPNIENNELPEALSDFILKYSRRYTPSPDGSKTDETDSASIWTDSPKSMTSLTTADSACNSPASANSAPNNSPTAPRGGQISNYQRSEDGESKFGLPRQNSSDSGFYGNGRMQSSRTAKDSFRALIQSSDMDEAWAWTCKCIQHHPNALSYQDADKDMLLHIVSQHVDLAKIYALVEQMIKFEARINETPLFDIPNEKGRTPLFIAVEKRQNELVDYLLEAGASPNSHLLLGDRDAPLHYAATRGLTRIIQTLCSYPQTNLNGMNGIGLTPLLCAIKAHGNVDEEVSSIVSSIGAIQLLLRSGADPTISEASTGKTIIHLAVERMQPELIEILRACLNDNVLTSLANKLDFNGKSPMNYLNGFRARMEGEILSRIELALVACGAKQ